jgi:hypothetical protein
VTISRSETSKFAHAVASSHPMMLKGGGGGGNGGEGHVAVSVAFAIPTNLHRRGEGCPSDEMGQRRATRCGPTTHCEFVIFQCALRWRHFS